MKLAMSMGLGIALLGGQALAQQNDSTFYGHPHWGMAGAGWFFGPIMMLLFLALIVAAVVLVLRWLAPGASSGGPASLSSTPSADRNAALAILRERFARGEIDRAEFEERRQVLSE